MSVLGIETLAVHIAISALRIISRASELAPVKTGNGIASLTTETPYANFSVAAL